MDKAIYASIKHGYDPKNRMVSLLKSKLDFSVVKQGTMFNKTVKTLAEAEKIYNQQLSCSQN